VRDDDERVPLLVRLASLRETHLKEPAAAIETYRQVLELDARTARRPRPRAAARRWPAASTS
jgi:hypothetical protein